MRPPSVEDSDDDDDDDDKEPAVASGKQVIDPQVPQSEDNDSPSPPKKVAKTLPGGKQLKKPYVYILFAFFCND